LNAERLKEPAMSAPRFTRRLTFRAAAATAVASWVGAPAWAQPRRTPLPAMTEGPYYPPRSWRSAQDDWDADLTQVRRQGQVLVARGEPLGLDLALVDARGRTIDGAEFEIWQCDTLAAYRHPDVPAAPSRHDPGFQGFGTARTDAQGGVRFRTIRPVPYPGRTPHIHVKLRHPSFGEFTSQLFVDGDPGNARDFLWRALRPEAQAAAAIKLQPGASDGLRWQARHAVVVPV
jgi:protocatechuate 3,4-dioxygenase beta subunit